MRSMIVLPSPMRALLAPKSGLYRFLRHLLVQSEEIGERLGIYGRLTRSVNHNICSSETAIHRCLYSDRLKEVDVLTTTNGLLKTCRSFFLRVVRLLYLPNFPQKKQLNEYLFSFTCNTCIAARVNVSIVSGYCVLSDYKQRVNCK